MVLFNMPYLAQTTSGLTTAHLPILNPSFQLRSSQVRQESGVLSSADSQPCGPQATKLMPRVLCLPRPQLPRLHVTLLLPFPLAHHLRPSDSIITVSVHGAVTLGTLALPPPPAFTRHIVRVKLPLGCRLSRPQPSTCRSIGPYEPDSSRDCIQAGSGSVCPWQLVCSTQHSVLEVHLHCSRCRRDHTGILHRLSVDSRLTSRFSCCEQ